jgi:hypothetical protein
VSRHRLTALAALSFSLLAACGSSSHSTTTASVGASASTTTSAAGGSGNSSGAGAGSAKANPCSLLTRDEATAALGEQTDAGKPTDGPVPGCIFPATNGAHLADAVQLQVQDIFVFDGTLQAKDNPQVASSFTFETVSGLGDQAFFQIPAATGTAVSILLAFKKKGVAIYVSVDNRNLSVDQIKAADRQLATAAAGRV